MKNFIESTQAGKFLINKCEQSEAWSWAVTATGIGLMVLITLL